jgi:hypothetical protein
LEKKVDQPTPALFQDDFVAGIHPRWVVWLRAFWQQTPISQHGRDEIAGQMEPRLEISWNPADALATPAYVMAELQPNPRNVEEEAWLKLYGRLAP